MKKKQKTNKELKKWTCLTLIVSFLNKKNPVDIGGILREVKFGKQMEKDENKRRQSQEGKKKKKRWMKNQSMKINWIVLSQIHFNIIYISFSFEYYKPKKKKTVLQLLLLLLLFFSACMLCIIVVGYCTIRISEELHRTPNKQSYLWFLNFSTYQLLFLNI